MITIYTDTKSIEIFGNRNIFPLFSALLFYENSTLKSYFKLTEKPELADIFIVPYFYDYLLKIKQKEVYQNLITTSQLHQKPLWVAIGGDLPLSLHQTNLYVFKMAAFQSKLQPKNFVMPVFIGDPIERFFDNDWRIIARTNLPLVGYVGHAKNGFLKFLRTIYIYFNYNFKVFIGSIKSAYSPLYFSSHIRYKYLKILEKSKLLHCKFVYRDKYKAGAKTDIEKNDTTQHFFENIKNTQYTFCIRGGGNFSVRLYETMAMGRIPVQMDTDCVLPLEAFVDWKSHVLIIQEKDIKIADSIIRNFHDSFTEEEFQNFQFKVRQFWKNNLTREGYFINIHNLFIQNKL